MTQNRKRHFSDRDFKTAELRTPTQSPRSLHSRVDWDRQRPSPIRQTLNTVNVHVQPHRGPPIIKLRPIWGYYTSWNHGNHGFVHELFEFGKIYVKILTYILFSNPNKESDKLLVAQLELGTAASISENTVPCFKKQWRTRKQRHHAPLWAYIKGTTI